MPEVSNFPIIVLLAVAEEDLESSPVVFFKVNLFAVSEEVGTEEQLLLLLVSLALPELFLNRGTREVEDGDDDAFDDVDDEHLKAEGGGDLKCDGEYLAKLDELLSEAFVLEALEPSGASFWTTLLA